MQEGQQVLDPPPPFFWFLHDIKAIINHKINNETKKILIWIQYLPYCQDKLDSNNNLRKQA